MQPEEPKPEATETQPAPQENPAPVPVEKTDPILKTTLWIIAGVMGLTVVAVIAVLMSRKRR